MKGAEVELLNRPPSILEKCRPILSELLNDVQGLGFNENPRAGGEIEYLLSGVPLSYAVARGQYPVLPLLRTDSNFFWIGASLRFATELSDKRLVSVSLLFFEGLATDPEKRPLLRAEWDEWEGSHAQPHWHVYPSIFINTQPTYEFEESNLAPKEFRATSPFEREGFRGHAARELRLDRFHYAMSTLWHSQGLNSHKFDLSEEYLLKWLQGCIAYTQSQFKFLSS